MNEAIFDFECPECGSDTVCYGKLLTMDMSVIHNKHYRWCLECDYKWSEYPEIKQEEAK
jgi:DNA-directed RNA polymerase subunit M/transcription elongation factor TFIIS